ncbi:MAG TPA: GGDEF domain-containing protein [Nakamurella sp.]|nr:GGDEF domain-containing protein [Nakamurella sp.]
MPAEEETPEQETPEQETPPRVVQAGALGGALGEPWHRTPVGFRWWWVTMVAAVIAVFAALALWAPGPDLEHVLTQPGMLILLGLMLLADLYPTMPWMRTANPLDDYILSTPLAIAAMLAYGPQAAVAFLLAGAAMTLALRMVWWRVVLNTALWGLQGAAAAGTLILLTPSHDWTDPVPVWAMLPLSAALGVVSESLNLVLIGVSLTLVGAISWAEHLADWRNQLAVGSLALTAPIAAVLAWNSPALLPLLALAMLAAQSGLRAVSFRTTQAGTDPLTSIANRATLLARLRERITGRPGANGTVTLLLIDLDGFKLVNDRYGHLAGDRVLVEVAQRLEAATRSGDLVARFGGDEFAVLLGQGAAARTAEDVAARIREAVARPIQIGERSVLIGVSVGAAVTTGARDARALLAGADAELYRAKAARPEARPPGIEPVIDDPVWSTTSVLPPATATVGR